jgi:accessory gene regulator protein AgrB
MSLAKRLTIVTVLVLVLVLALLTASQAQEAFVGNVVSSVGLQPA